MNWGLFLGLEAFLLPLSLALRIALRAVASGDEWGEPVQKLRLVAVLLLISSLVGKVPATAFVVSGEFEMLARVTEGFMLSPLGLIQIGALTAGVIVADLAGPRIEARLGGDPAARSSIGRSLGIIGVCLLLGVAGVQ